MGAVLATPAAWALAAQLCGTGRLLTRGFVRSVGRLGWDTATAAGHKGDHSVRRGM
jgi:hypothetical protein